MADSPGGVVHISNDVLADLAGYAALESYGVVGMASPSVAGGVARLLPAHRLRTGVKVVSTDDSVEVDLYVIVEHGTQIAEVSHNLADRVKYVLSSIAAVAVARVDVHVMGVKVRQAR